MTAATTSPPASGYNPRHDDVSAPIYRLVAIAVLLLTVVPIGLAVFWLGFVRGDSPCVMCWEQRMGMLLLALVGLFVLRFGAKPKYVGMAVLIAAWGMFMGMRHTGMHAARDIGQGFSLEIMGAHTYTWALFVYWISVVAIGLLLLALRPEATIGGTRPFGRLERATFIAYMVVVGANAVQAFASTGPPPFMGQSDPIRFSFNPRHWHWSVEEWLPTSAPISLRGRFGVEKPDILSANPDPSAGPLGTLPPATISRHYNPGLPLDGAPTDFACTDGKCLITTAHGFYLLNDSLTRIYRRTTVDPGYSVDLGTFAGAAFLDRGEMLAVGENKSYVVLKFDDTPPSIGENFRYFLDHEEDFEEVTRGRFGTVRARLMYVQSAAYDSATNSIYTVTVPNRLVKRMIVSRFDRGDLTLSEEWTPSLAAASGLALAKGRSVGEFMVTGATVVAGRMYAVSAAYPALLTIDLATHAVIGARALPGVARPIGLASRGNELYVLGEDGTLSVIPQAALPAGAR